MVGLGEIEDGGGNMGGGPGGAGGAGGTGGDDGGARGAQLNGHATSMYSGLTSHSLGTRFAQSKHCGSVSASGGGA
eukprot:5036755-Prymnesium_polylepis.1